MPRFNVSLLRYLSKEDFRVLHSLEVGMRNHELVPMSLVSGIAQIPHGHIYKILRNLSQNNLISYQRKKHSKVEGYRLTNLGYDYLALKALSMRGIIASVGNQIGKGKESDVYVVANKEGEQLCLKIHRLGRISSRNMTTKRDYLHGYHHVSWLYLSRVAAYREFCFLQEMHKIGIQVPKPIDNNRHCVVMQLIPAFPLNHVKEVQDPISLFDNLIHIIAQLAAAGYVHGDFNEFNLLVDDEGIVTLIDLPQMLPSTHPLAKSYLKRDLDCIREFFCKRFGINTEEISVDSIKMGKAKAIRELEGEVNDEMLIKHLRINPDNDLDSIQSDEDSDEDDIDLTGTKQCIDEQASAIIEGIDSLNISDISQRLIQTEEEIGKFVIDELEPNLIEDSKENTESTDIRSEASSVLSIVDIKMQAKWRVKKELMKEKTHQRSRRKSKGQKDPKGKGKRFNSHVTSDDFFI
ncbi:Serine/threonine-protein kinase RIO2 [Oopsacas minuta]|uniref:Serine/threonine-protein kinase RIO2 n=1 Tax=Oopsacas minuta TaxID=111878 RepID=A0AAV7JRX2_9METZ|nr:Serine/threonine-protein kinase RIO2 [Oopsacas minuta]